MEVLSLPAAAGGMSSASLGPRRTSPTLATAAVAQDEPGGPSSDSCSLASTSTDLTHQHPDAMDLAQRTHHLLKHCLSQSQRSAALAQFNTGDPREAAKEIARMGQRELQAKFKEVYGSATKSNNNSWLRRKLYEAVGVAPLKTNTKGKTRKAGSGSSSRKASGHKEGGGSIFRSPKLAAIKVKRTAETPCASPQRLVSTGPLSILDMHQHSVLVSNDTSDSEDGDDGSFPQSSPSTPSSPLGLPFSSGPIFSIQQQAALGTRPHRACTLPPAPAGFVPVAEPRSPLAGLHWADGFPAAPQPTQQLSAATSAAAPFLSAGSQTLPPLDAGFSSAFKPMELEQEVSPLWDAEAEAGPQPWYFGSGLDLTVLALPKVAHMDCSSNAAATVCADDDDEIPLLNLDLGAIDVSI